MKALSCILGFLLPFWTLAQQGSTTAELLNRVRAQYEDAVGQAAVCRELISSLEAVPAKDALLNGYLGAFYTIWANHTANPLKKLSTFKKGKTKLEEAILRSPQHAELRFIRLSIQLHIPKILGYSGNIEDDRQFLRTHKQAIRSRVVLKRLETLLTLS